MPDIVGVSVEPHNGHVFNSLSCCFMTFTGVAFSALNTVLVVGVVRIFGIWVGLGICVLAGTSTFLLAICAADFPPHDPHGIMLFLFLRQHVVCV